MIYYLIEAAKKRYPGRRITAALLMDLSGVERKDWEGEMIASLPYRFRQKAMKLAEEARQEAEGKAAKGLGQQNVGSRHGWVN
jgi:hypothetical protein